QLPPAATHMNCCCFYGGLCDTGDQTPFGLFRIALVVVPFLYVGTQISKSFAALLEEHDIFVPEDDDDDD
uniref:Essential MCU regulator, mitochondrial n=2 Tax=Stegastes partitus TaxID=144197 RepID=A0A3B4ZTY2_9TELE